MMPSTTIRVTHLVLLSWYLRVRHTMPRNRYYPPSSPHEPITADHRDEVIALTR